MMRRKPFTITDFLDIYLFETKCFEEWIIYRDRTSFIDYAELSRPSTEGVDTTQSLKHCVLNSKQDG
jgi:hypothetical protein